MAESVWLLLLGFGTGTLGVMVGIGGGIVLVPVLLFATDMEPAVVAGTSLALVAVNSYAGSWTYRRMGLVDLRSGLLFSAAAVPGSLLAPFVVADVAGDAFRVLFGLLLVGVAVQLALRPWTSRERASGPNRTPPPPGATRHITTSEGEVFDYRFNEPLATSVNVGLGFISAFFGTGGGFLRTPLLVTAFGFPVRVAVATSVFALTIYATAGAAVHVYLGHVDWYPTVLWAGAGLLVGGQIGARLAARVQASWIMRLLTLVLALMGVRLVFEGLVD